ncbi:MAG: beta-ketoacyl-ACP reductase, partial [Verrucomicrobia bacterium]|nr:beta-ketoacyl-ACP reductase [Verrucomicrobiota bacterium]
MNLNSQTALVTGGAVRIGRAIVEQLAAAGARVVIHCRDS